MRFRKPSQKILLHHNLTDGDVDLFVKAVIYDQNLTNVSPSPGYVVLAHLSNGTYTNFGLTPFNLSEGNYLIQYTVFNDAGLTSSSNKYGSITEELLVSDFEQTILTEIPDNILLDNDPRLDNLNTIPSLATSSYVDSKATEIVNNINSNTDTSDGRAV